MIKQLWTELSNLALDLNGADFHVTLEYAGHVNMFRLSYYKGGYAEEKNSIWLDGEWMHKMTEESLEKSNQLAL